MTILDALPARAGRRLAWWKAYPAARRVIAEGESFRAFRAAAQADSVPGAAPVAVTIRAQGARRVLIRPGTSDWKVTLETSAGFHRPPVEIGHPKLIWDLGANIGLTMVDLAERFPKARIVGVEMNPAAAALAQRNVAPWANRCELVEAAVWTDDGEVSYAIESGSEYAASLTVGGPANATALSLNSLLTRYGAPDYVKMDIEGTEAEVLRRRTDWATDVGSIAVECHAPYTVEDCTSDLERLGFEVRRVHQSWRRPDSAVGIRPSPR